MSNKEEKLSFEDLFLDQGDCFEAKYNLTFGSQILIKGGKLYKGEKFADTAFNELKKKSFMGVLGKVQFNVRLVLDQDL